MTRSGEGHHRGAKLAAEHAAGIAFLWFVGVLRDRIGAREDRFFATVLLGSGLLFVAMIFAAAGALCHTLCAATGITNRSLRTLMTGLPGAPYTMARAGYDLSRLRRNGLITRRPHANTYDLTPDGLMFAIFYAQVHDRVLAPLFTVGQPQAPPQIRAALRTIEHQIDQQLAAARLPISA